MHLVQKNNKQKKVVENKEVTELTHYQLKNTLPRAKFEGIEEWMAFVGREDRK